MPEALTRDERDSLYGSMAKWPGGADLANRIEETIRRLEAQLDHERRTNTALRMEIDAWRANDEGRAVRLRAALEEVALGHLVNPQQAAYNALAADREGR